MKSYLTCVRQCGWFGHGFGHCGNHREKIYELQDTIVKSGIEAKVKEMKQRIEQARSAAKKGAAKKLGDDKVWWR